MGHDPTLEISDEAWEHGHIAAKKWMLTNIAGSDRYLVCHPDNRESLSEFDRYFVKNLSRVSIEFNAASSLLRTIFLVTLKRDDWSFSTCTCLSFHKVYMCSHIIGVAIHQKLCFVPRNIVEKQEITTLAKRGQKKKATPALSRKFLVFFFRD